MASTKPRMVVLAVSLGIATSFGLGSDAALAKSAKKSSVQPRQTTKSANPQGDEQAIRDFVSKLSKLHEAGDAKGLSALWAEDCEYVDIDGTQTKGRKDLEQRFASVFAAKGIPRMQVATDSVKFLAPSVALAEGRVQREQDGQIHTDSRFSLILVRGADGWLISKASERAFVASTNYDYLKPFDWIVGNWTAQNDGTSVNLSAEWVPSKNFILCRYVTTKQTGKTSVDMQIIGWDPILNQPRSWHFDNTGGFGQGLWSKVNNQWSCEASGVESDGSTTKSRNIFLVNGPDKFSWSSQNRSVNGMAVGDAASLTVQRVVK